MGLVTLILPLAGIALVVLILPFGLSALYMIKVKKGFVMLLGCNKYFQESRA
jgi:hypothetical protein